VGTARAVYRRPACKLVANFIGETDFIEGNVVSADRGGVVVETAFGRFYGVLGDVTRVPPAGASVTLSVRPECWTLSRETPERNGVKGRIGACVYLGETAQYDFRAGEQTLKIIELNPRFLDQSGRGELFASAAPEDVVVLTE
jgi:iron(III) transport system ATP-binding protein